MRTFVALITACLYLVGHHASAQTITPETRALLEVLKAKLATNSTNDPKWRASLAAALHRYCESVLVQVPRNTPQEDGWVDSELQDAVSMRALRARDIDWARLGPTGRTPDCIVRLPRDPFDALAGCSEHGPGISGAPINRG
jgi:hypothetical protein